MLATWEIPNAILDAAPESPWRFPTELFQRRADAAVGIVATPSARHAAEALDPTGSVLDVGAGGGAASLALVKRLTRLTAVDSSAEALSGLSRRATHNGIAARTVLGEWPHVAAEVGTHDLVICHHVLYNVPAIEPFLAALDLHARRRVVIEMTERHPLHGLAALWLQFHGLRRPDGPTASDALAIVDGMGIAAQVERWQPDTNEDYLDPDERTSLVRRRLCLPVERQAEVAAALENLPNLPAPRVTIWWDPPPSAW